MAIKKRSHSRKSPANRDAYISGAFRQFLSDRVEGFESLKPSDQLNLTDMISQATTRYREHSHFSGCAFFGMHELESRFGRSRFKGINDGLKVFFVESEWSKIEGRTKPFCLTQRFADLRAEFFSRRNSEMTNLLAEDGDVRHVAPRNALMSKRKTESSIESTRKGWPGKTVKSAVPINILELEKLGNLVRHELDAHVQGKRDRSTIDPEHAKNVLDEIQQILHIANNNVAPNCVIHKYQESISGRMYATNVNLQNTHRQVRMAALHGFWDYDIENCHFAIIQQMANNTGFQCQAINHYLKNKAQIRSELARHVGVTELQIKKALLAMVYGASFSENSDAAIPETLGSTEIANAFYDHELVQKIAKDIKSATQVILAKTVRKRGRIANFRNLEMSTKGKKSRQLLAHLIQGVEAAALEAAHDVYSDQIVLLQHDGFTATRPDLNIERIESAIALVTGYQLKISRSAPLAANPKAALIDLDFAAAVAKLGPVKNPVEL